MEQKGTSTVKSVQGAGTFDSAHGMLYKYEYHLANGVTLVANHKTQSPFAEGTEVEFEIKGTNNFGSWGAVKKPSEGFPQSSGGFAPKKTSVDSEAILMQVCLKIAGDVHATKSMTLPSPEELNEYALKLAILSQQSIQKLKA
jgi:hypothetical protein